MKNTSSKSIQTHSAPWMTLYDKALQLQQSGELTQAWEAIESAREVAPAERQVLNLYAVLLAQHQRYQEAFAVFESLLERDPRDIEVLSNMGFLKRNMNDYPAACEYLSRALAVQPRNVNAALNLGVTYQSMGLLQEAIKSFQRVLRLQPKNIQALFNLGVAQQTSFDYQAAHATYRRVLAFSPGHEGAHANLIFTQHFLMPQKPEEIAKQAKQLGVGLARLKRPRQQWLVSADPNRRLRIGLVSADLKDHPVGYFLEAFLAAEAVSQFDWVAYHNSGSESALSQRIKSRFLAWRTTFTWTDAELAAAVEQDQIDVLIDLSGYTAGHRMAMFSLKPAPLQLSWLGYFGTTGLAAIDAVIADPVAVPAEETAWFSEQVAYLPHTRFCFTPPENAPEVVDLPALQRGYLTFGCYQQLSKINDQVLRCWAQIAQRLPNARWRIRSGGLNAESENLPLFKARVKAAGLPLERVELLGPLARQDYLADYGGVDLVLDTFAYPGGTTTVEALWMGVPTLNLALPGMLGRQGQSLLMAAGLADWVVSDVDAYISTAVNWGAAERWSDLAVLRAELRQQVAASPLFDAERFAKDWGMLVRGLWQQVCLRAWA